MQGWALGRVSRSGDFGTSGFLTGSEWLRVKQAIFDLGSGIFRKFYPFPASPENFLKHNPDPGRDGSTRPGTWYC